MHYADAGSQMVVLAFTQTATAGLMLQRQCSSFVHLLKAFHRSAFSARIVMRVWLHKWRRIC
jgi:hypothetical protein